MGQDYLYVSSPQGSSGLSKIGFTTQSPLKRAKQLEGQTTQKFELRGTQQVLRGRGRQAEQMLFTLLDAAGVERAAGPRKEQFRIEPDEACRLLAAAAEGTLRLYGQEGSNEAPSTPAAGAKFPRGGIWPLVAAYPITLDGRQATLAELVSRVQTHASSVRRLSRMGFELCSQPEGALVFLVCWQSAKAVAEWVLLQKGGQRSCGPTKMASFPTRLRVKISTVHAHRAL